MGADYCFKVERNPDGIYFVSYRRIQGPKAYRSVQEVIESIRGIPDGAFLVRSTYLGFDNHRQVEEMIEDARAGIIKKRGLKSLFKAV